MSHSSDGREGGIYAQRFNASGTKVGGEEQVYVSSSYEHDPSVALLTNGAFVITWTTERPDLASQEVFARQYTPVSSTTSDSGNNELTGTAGNDSMNGGAGNDRLVGLSGNDVLTGSTGADIIFGGAGSDRISADREIGFDGNVDVDQIYAGDGNDVIFAGYGDIVDGGAGFDVLNLSYVGASHGITGDTNVLFRGLPLSPGGGTVANIERFDAVALTEFRDVMVIGDQADPATAYGYGGDDHLIGQEHRVVFHGGEGNDLLVGSTANDELYGDAGNDTLIGHLGIDFLCGGAGSDRFIINQLDVLDRIIDFEHGVDKVDVSDIDANALVAGNQAFAFIGFDEFTGVAGQLRTRLSSSATYVVEGDVNGDGIADLIIDLGLPSALTQGDFLL